MAVFTNTWTTYAEVGIREDLSNKISNISPEETPALSSAGKGEFKTTFSEWQQDSLAAAVTTNARLEGNETTFAALSPTIRVGNYAQISDKSLIISGTDEVVDKAGRKSAMSYQVIKKGKELKLDQEATILSRQPALAGGVTTARQTAGLMAWIKTNVDVVTTANNPSYTNVPTATRTDGTARTFTEAMLKNVIKMCWTNGGHPDTVLCSATNKVLASAFVGISTKYNELTGEGPGTIYAAADTYVSDFGKFFIVADRNSRDKDVLVMDFDLFQVGYLRKFRVEPLAKTGDAEKALLLIEWGTKVMNEAGIGLVADCGA